MAKTSPKRNVGLEIREGLRELSFIDEELEFLYVPASQVLSVAAATGGIP